MYCCDLCGEITEIIYTIPELSGSSGYCPDCTQILLDNIKDDEDGVEHEGINKDNQ